MKYVQDDLKDRCQDVRCFPSDVYPGHDWLLPENDPIGGQWRNQGDECCQQKQPTKDNASCVDSCKPERPGRKSTCHHLTSLQSRLCFLLAVFSSFKNKKEFMRVPWGRHTHTVPPFPTMLRGSLRGSRACLCLGYQPNYNTVSLVGQRSPKPIR